MRQYAEQSKDLSQRALFLRMAVDWQKLAISKDEGEDRDAAIILGVDWGKKRKA